MEEAAVVRRRLLWVALSLFVLGSRALVPLAAEEAPRRVLAAPGPTSAEAQGAAYRSKDPLGGSADIGTQIRFDAEPKRALVRRSALQRWFAWKDRLEERTGLSWQANYNLLYMKASESLGHDEAAGGVFELNATWNLVNRGGLNTGTLGFRVESRHKLGTAIAPAGLGAEIGSLWRPDVLWSERDLSLSQLWWEQRFYKGRGAVRFGKLVTPAVIYDNFLLRVPQFAIQNEAYTFSATPYPDNGLGVVAAVFPTRNVYVLGGVHDANAFIEDSGFETVFDGEYFKALEFGWTPAFEKRKTDNYHITLWHVDSISASGRPEGWGGTVSLQRYLRERWLPFARYSYAANGVLPIEQLFQGGVGYRVRDHDSIALGASYATPTDGALRNQWGLEIYYRAYLTRAVSLVPGLQMVWDPSRNPGADHISIFSMRIRVSL
jgi:porin